MVSLVVGELFVGGGDGVETRGGLFVLGVAERAKTCESNKCRKSDMRSKRVRAVMREMETNGATTCQVPLLASFME